jgi:hypothetical protein
MSNIKTYKWMKDYQRELYVKLCTEFDFISLTDIGDFLGLKNPYHGARLIFEAQKQNLYLRKLIQTKKLANERIHELEESLSHVNNFRNSIESLVDNLNLSLESIQQIKARIK